MKYWHELEIGSRIDTQRHTVAAAEVQEFALEFDPQPYHLDREAAEASIFGGLCASGWQANAITMKLLSEALSAKQFALLGVRSVNSCRWKKPLFVGETVAASAQLNAREDDALNPKFGLWHCAVELSNQAEQTVLLMDTHLVLGKAAVQ